MSVLSGYQWDQEIIWQLLALLLRDPTFYPRNRQAVKPEYFGHPDMMVVVAFLQDHVNKYRDLPTPLVLKEQIRTVLKDEPARATRAIEVVEQALIKEVQNGAWIRDSALEFGRRRAVSLVLGRMALMFDGGQYDEMVSDLSEANRVGKDVEDLGQRLFENPSLERWFGIGQPRGVSTGWAVLDQALDGGSRPGELYCVAAPPKGGKTTLLLNLMFSSMMLGRRVAYYTLEVSEDIILQRLTSIGTGKTKEEVRANPNAVKEHMERMRSTAGLGDIFVKAYPTGKGTVEMIDTHLRILADSKNFQPDVVVVDYADLLRARRNEDDWKALNELFIDLRGLAVESRIPIWTASQFTRGGSSKAYGESTDVAGSFGKNAIVDAMFGLSATDAEKAQNLKRLNFLLLRNGPSDKTVVMQYNEPIYWMSPIQQSFSNLYELKEKDDGKTKPPVFAGAVSAPEVNPHGV